MRAAMSSLVLVLVLVAGALPGLVAPARGAQLDAPDRVLEVETTAGGTLFLINQSGFAFMLLDQIIDPEIYGGYPPSWGVAEVKTEGIEPHARIEAVPAWPCCIGFNSSTLMKGTLDITLPVQVAVIRLSNPSVVEFYEPDRTVAIDPGDTIIRADSTQGVMVNTGDVPVEFVTIGLRAKPVCPETSYTFRVPDGYMELRWGYGLIDPLLDTGLFRVTLAYFELQKDTSITLDIEDSLPAQLMLADRGLVKIFIGDPDSPDFGKRINMTSTSIDLNLLFGGLYGLTNTEKNPAALYFLRIQPAG